MIIEVVLETSELLKKVRKIEIKTKGISKELFAGEYHSAFKGRGMSFSEVRDYQYGDDIRNIDWNVTARMGVPHVKVYEEERELTLMLLVDISRSSFFGTAHQFRNELITEICAVLAFSALNNNDKVGLIFFADQVQMYIPPKKGKKHVLRLIRELIDAEPVGQATKLDTGLKFFNNLIKKRSICFILSDFFSEDFSQALQVAARKHDLIGMQIFDPFEKELPKAGMLRLMDSESGRICIVDTLDNETRRVHRQQFENRYTLLKDLFTRHGADFISMDSGSSYIHELHRFFSRRTNRR